MVVVDFGLAQMRPPRSEAIWSDPMGLRVERVRPFAEIHIFGLLFFCFGFKGNPRHMFALFFSKGLVDNLMFFVGFKGDLFQYWRYFLISSWGKNAN